MHPLRYARAGSIYEDGSNRVYALVNKNEGIREVYGTYIRCYADHFIYAESDNAARQQAIEDFKARSAELQWLDTDYGNLALPSIVSLQCDDPPGDVLEGYDFPITSDDARQYAANKLLAALETLMPEIENEIDQRQHSGIDEEWIELDRKAADARAAIAEATAIKDQPSNRETQNDAT